MNREFLRGCDEIVVLMLDGWEESEGVRAELAIAAELSLPIGYLAPDRDAQSIPPRCSSRK
jgi:hypothetical protein